MSKHTSQRIEGQDSPDCRDKKSQSNLLPRARYVPGFPSLEWTSNPYWFARYRGVDADSHKNEADA